MANIIAVEIAVMMAIIQRLENLFICGIDISLRGFGGRLSRSMKRSSQGFPWSQWFPEVSALNKRCLALQAIVVELLC